MKRSSIKRTRFKRKKPNGTRAKSAGLRDLYLRHNPVCEWHCGKLACEVDHIIQLAGGSYETTENYFSTCRPCHDKKHSDNRKREQIAIKVGKGEWFADEHAEFNFFGYNIYFDGRDR